MPDDSIAPDNETKDERRRRMNREKNRRYRERHRVLIRARQKAWEHSKRSVDGKDPNWVDRARRHRLKMKTTYKGQAQWLCKSAKKRSKRKGYLDQFTINSAWVLDQIKDQDFRCVESGYPFDLHPERAFYPFQPSLDRIDNSLGYSKKNTRVVCLMYNLARNSSTDDEIIDFARHLVAETDGTA